MFPAGRLERGVRSHGDMRAKREIGGGSPLWHGERRVGDRRHDAADLYDRIETKRQAIEHERRTRSRRLDDGPILRTVFANRRSL
jgi:hypothetical protein